MPPRFRGDFRLLRLSSRIERLVVVRASAPPLVVTAGGTRQAGECALHAVWPVQRSRYLVHLDEAA